MPISPTLRTRSVRASHVQLMPAAILLACASGVTWHDADAQTCGAQWSRVDDGTPPVRRYHSSTFDAARNRVMLFGGEGNPIIYSNLGSNTRLLGDLWEWDGVRWRIASMGNDAVPSQPPSSVGPSGYLGAAMVYRADRRTVVVDGGSTNPLTSSGSGELWEWDGAAWTQLGIGGTAPGTNGGSRLANHSMVFLPDNATLAATQIGSSLTILTPTGWRSLTGNGIPNTPNFQAGSFLAVAPVGGPVTADPIVAFEGANTAASRPVFTNFIQPGANPQLGFWTSVPGSSSAVSSFPRAAYDTTRNRIVQHGNLTANTVVGDTREWRLDTGTWEPFTGPTPGSRAYHSMAFDPVRNVTVLIGGLRASTSPVFTPGSSDVWEFDGTRWTNRTPDAIAPRSWHAMAFDEVNNRTIVFGGVDAGGGVGNVGTATWSWNGASWTRLPPTLNGPQPRFRHAMAFDRNRGKVVMHGGGWNDPGNTFTGLDDFWELDGDTWRPIQTTGPTPPAYRGHGLVFDTARNVLVLQGGTSPTTFGGTWELDGTTWTPRTTATQPTSRRDFSLVYDEARARTLLVGGTNLSNSAPLSDTWEYDGTDWTRVIASAADPEFGSRTSTFAAYDAARRRVVLFGGLRSNRRTADTWEWTGTSWARLSGQGPRARAGGAMVYDRSRQRFVLFGGDIHYPRSLFANLEGPQEFGDTWEGVLTGFGAAIRTAPRVTTRIIPPGESISFTAAGDGGGPGFPLAFNWLRRNTGTPPQLIADGGTVSGATTEVLTISSVSAADSGTYLFRVSTPCAQAQTTSGTTIIVRCPADVSGPTPGTPDGAVNIEDLADFLDLYEQGAAAADLDDGTGTSTLDRSVTIEDLLWFLSRYELGC